jgi:endoglucanase
MALRRMLTGVALALVLALPAIGSKARAEDAPPTPFIVVDQFGYLPAMQKIAVIRSPELGFDAGWTFTPGAVYQVVDAKTGAVVYEGKPVAFKDGAIDAASGDHTWRFDFSAVSKPGRYLIRDTQAGYDSYPFDIGPNVYKPVLRAAVRMLYYQRADTVKDARFAGAGWADGLDHMGKGQDGEARLFSTPNDASTARDLHGGWFDAGDYNKYTSWTATYVVSLLGTYAEKPQIWTDDFGIPESGNGVPDLLDEVKWGLDWLVRMQNDDGSVLSVMGLSHASPPSAAKGPSYYGPASTAATYSAAAAYAYGAKIYGAFPQFSSYSAGLKARAVKAFAWAQAHPDVTFYNNDPRDHSQGLAAGQQEPDARGRAQKALAAAVYLFDLTGDTSYRAYVDAHYDDGKGDYDATEPLLYYAGLTGATPEVARAIKDSFVAGFEHTWQAAGDDAYMAWMSGYWWGSNGSKASTGDVFADEARLGLGPHSPADAMAHAAGYIHYIDGVNPLGKVYLSNMKSLGASNSVNRFYHTWYSHDSARWADVRTSPVGPAPGYLVGGPNASYTWSKGCPQINAGCGTAPPSPPVGQPGEKSYADFSDGWPIDSWEVTEDSEGYQTPYIRLLAQFVD